MVAEGLFHKEELRTYKKAEEFFWSVRITLHLITGKANELITFDLQTELSQALKYKDHPGLSGVERFMKHYFLVTKQVGDLTRVFCASLEDREQKKRIFRLSRFSRKRKVGDFYLDGDRLTFDKAIDIKKDPVKMLEIFLEADRHDSDIHPEALRAISENLTKINSHVRKNPKACETFLNILTSKKNPSKTLMRLNEAGVFGRFIPDFGRVVAQMQHDMYHHYTVDEHTIRAIGLVSRIEGGNLTDDHPLSSQIIHQLVSRRALYAAVLFHDIAKGRGGDHSELGAKIVLKECPRLGLGSAETELVAWLVRHHLLMSNVAFKRDLSDPKTIQDFVNQVKSPERLKLLLLLTVVDIRAVGPIIDPMRHLSRRNSGRRSRGNG